MSACKLSESTAFVDFTLLSLLVKKSDENYFKMEYKMNSSGLQNMRHESASFYWAPFFTGWV